jgi:hypothetical protein
MNVVGDVFRELFSMFVADARLTGATCTLVAVVAALILGFGIPALAGGLLLLAGCVVILIEAAVREAAVRRRR